LNLNLNATVDVIVDEDRGAAKPSPMP